MCLIFTPIQIFVSRTSGSGSLHLKSNVYRGGVKYDTITDDVLITHQVFGSPGETGIYVLKRTSYQWRQTGGLGLISEEQIIVDLLIKVLLMRRFLPALTSGLYNKSL